MRHYWNGEISSLYTAGKHVVFKQISCSYEQVLSAKEKVNSLHRGTAHAPLCSPLNISISRYSAATSAASFGMV